MASKPLSEDIIRLFTDVFRFILPDVNPDNKDALAPGELGINYDSGVFYFKDPYTLEVRTPNSIEALQFIEDHYNYETGELTADRIGNLRIYTDVTHIDGIESLDSVTIDTIISKMAAPAVLLAHTETDNYKMLNLPARNGLLEITKINDYAVSANFYNGESSVNYIGQYNAPSRQFMYWYRDEDSFQNYAEAEGNGTSQTVTIDKEIEDLMVLLIKVTNDTQPTATWSFNGSGSYQLVDLYGEPIADLLTQNSIIMLIRDELLDRWILADSSKNIIYQTAMLIDKRLRSTIESVPDRVESIEQWLTGDATKFNVSNDVYECTADNTTSIPVSNYEIDSDVLLVNYNQTILRIGIDYSISADGTFISLLTSSLNTGDKVQLIVIKQNKFTISTP